MSHSASHQPLPRSRLMRGTALLFLTLCIAVTTAAFPVSAAATASLGGNVTDATDGALINISVTAYQENVYSPFSGWNSVTSTSTDSAGDFLFDGLTAGLYRVCFDDPGGSFVAECFDNQSTRYWEGGTEINLEDGAAISNINAQLELGGHIQGTVTDTSGQPLSGASVDAYREIDSYWQNVSSSNIDPNTGEYDIGGLSAGTYVICFNDFSGQTISECYDNRSSTPAEGTRITLTSSQILTGIDAELSEGGHITGTVTDSSGGVIVGAFSQTVGVTVYQWNGQWSDYKGQTQTSSVDGSYDIGGLATGTYRVCFNDYTGQWLNECYDNQPADNPNNGNDVAVTAGLTTPDIDAQLDVPGHISGTVTSPTGDPLADVNVDAYVWNSNGYWQNQGPSQTTDANGNYDMGGLQNGTHRVCFRDPTGNLLAECYDGQPGSDPSTGTDINVVVGATITGIDAELSEAGHIMGTVTDSSGGVIVDAFFNTVSVNVYQWNGQFSDYRACA